MSAAELAKYKDTRKAEDEANIKEADELVAKYEARDRAEAEREKAEREGAKGGKKEGGMFGFTGGGAAAKPKPETKEEHGGMFGFMGGKKKEEQKKEEHGGVFGFMHEKKEEPKHKEAGAGGIFGFMGGKKEEPKKEESGGVFGFLGHKEEHKDEKKKGWFAESKEEVKKEWWDILPEHDETKKKTAKRELVKAAASYQMSKMEDKFSNAVKKDNEQHTGMFGGKTKEKSGEGILPWQNNEPKDDKWLNSEMPTPLDGVFDLCSPNRKSDSKPGKGGLHHAKH